MNKGRAATVTSFVEGLPRSTLRDFKRKLTFVPAGHEYHERHEPRTLTRVAFFYFDPTVDAVCFRTLSRSDLAPRLFFEKCGVA